MTSRTPSCHRRPRSRAAAPSPPVGRHIAPLDGLRGLAVLGVLFFHAGHFSGGFLGVDLFFVLSGFLITGLLLREAQAHNGRIDLLGFWGRRARRLLPALAVMIAGTLLLLWAFGPLSLLRHALDDTPWVLANLTNWHFIADQVGYWQAGDTRVFGHLWSIAVEEQFYLLWPLVIGLAARGQHGGRCVAAVAVTGAALSLIVMMALTNPADTTRVYEGTDTRAFSLLLGALMATAPASRLMDRLGERAAGWWALTLACGIGAYWVTADGQSSPSLFHGGLFLHAVAAALLIACLVRAPHTPLGQILSTPGLRWFGLISYSLYLWHWPVYLMLSEERLGMAGWARTALIIGVSIAAAAVSKSLVEDPIRFRAPWAKGRAGAFALLVTFIALVALWALIPEPRTGVGTVDVTRLASGAPTEPGACPPGGAL
ncbi:acyltransferase family protein [Streptomyces anulatus]|uniref:acyltransferase family protein n=1 Tax=Streptomyces anulatus TaxID=1892 RepID=UPI00386B12CC|nr:acyltransferase [Streptomyces anulatus]